MTTLAEIAEAARAEVYGYTTTQEPTTYLAADFAHDDLEATVVSAAGFSRGIVQIDGELMMVDGVDRGKNTLILASASGRGIRATDVDSHPVGATVTMSPVIPFRKAQDAVKEALQADSGLFAVAEITFPYVATQNSYALPLDYREVLNVAWLPPGPDLTWHPIKRWNADRYSRFLVMGEAPVPGYPVKVTFTTDPHVPELDEDFSETGLPASCVDVIRWSAAWRLTAFLEPYNVVTRSAESDARDRQNGTGNKTQASQFMYGLYRQRLAEEVTNLQRQWPTRVHFVGV